MPYEDEDPPWDEPDAELDALARQVIGAAIEVHRRYGPGLNEAPYKAAMEVELGLRGIPFQSQVWVEIDYKGHPIGKRRIDLVVAERLAVELKAVEELTPLHKAQVKTYLKITSLTLALLINFNVILLKDFIKRIVHHPRAPRN